nr:CBS domain-containing protein [Methanothermus fervidus]
MKIKEIMTTNPIVVSPDMAATKVRSLFREERVRCFPVVNNGKLEGVITRGDVLRITSTRSNITVKGLMEKPTVLLTPDADVMDAVKRLVSAKKTHALIIKDSTSMELIGIVSVFDIFQSFLDAKIRPKKEKIKDIFTENPVVCDYEDPIYKVWDKMNESGYSGLPVLKNGKLIGIITRKDIIDSGYVRINRESKKHVRKNIEVYRVMKTPPVAVTKEDDVYDAMKLMIEKDIGRLPVVENPEYINNESYVVRRADLIGIVTRKDILKAYV